jgi:hypothetical protein
MVEKAATQGGYVWNYLFDTAGEVSRREWYNTIGHYRSFRQVDVAQLRTDYLAPGDFSRTQVGDESDTSPYRADPGIVGISTSTYIRNMSEFIRFLDGRR